MIANLGMAQTVDDLPVLYEPGVKWIVPPLFDEPHEPVSFAFTKIPHDIQYQPKK